MSTSNNDSNIPNAPGYDLPSPRFSSPNRSIEDNFDSTSSNNSKNAFYSNDDYTPHRSSQAKNNHNRPTEFVRIRVDISEARNSISQRVEKMRSHKANTLTLSTDLVVQMIEDYDKLYQNYETLADKFDEQRKSALTSEKLKEYIEIANQTIEMNDWCIKELDKRHEAINISRKELANRMGNDPGIQEEFDEILEDDVKARSDYGEIGEKTIYADTDKSDDASKKITGQGDVGENGGSRNKARSNERIEENYGIGNSRTDYVAEGINSGAGIRKAGSKTKNDSNEKDGKANNMWDLTSDGNNSQTWSDQMDVVFDGKGENVDESVQCWNVTTHNDEYNEEEHKHGREDKENKNGWGTRDNEDNGESISGYNGDTKEDKPRRSERQGGGNRGYRGGRKNGNNRW